MTDDQKNGMNEGSGPEEEATGAYDVLRDSTTAIQPVGDKSAPLPDLNDVTPISDDHNDESQHSSASTAQAYSNVGDDSTGQDVGLPMPDITNVQQLGMIRHLLRWGVILGALAIGAVSALVTILMIFVLSRAGSTIVQLPGSEKTVTRTVTETPEPTYIAPQTATPTTSYVPPTSTVVPSTTSAAPTSTTSESSKTTGATTSETGDDTDGPSTSPDQSEESEPGATIPDTPTPPIGGDPASPDNSR